MGRYRVSIIERPTGWEPASPDDVPPDPGPPLHVLAEADELFAAVRHAIEHNQLPDRTVEVRRLHVARPERGGKGDCSHCPARGLDCAREDWASLEQTATETRTG